MIYMIWESLFLDCVIWWEQLRIFKAKSSAIILINMFWWYENDDTVHKKCVSSVELILGFVKHEKQALCGKTYDSYNMNY